MKKILGIILAAMICVCTAVSALAAGTGGTLGGIKSAITAVKPDDVSQTEVSVLNKSVSVSRSLSVAAGELLVIPGGRTLTLKKGAQIDGGVYVEKGGKLTFSGGEVIINGSVVSDGKVTLKSAASAEVNGELYVSGQGTLSVGSDEKLFVDQNGKVVCLGKTNSSMLDIAVNPIAAVLKSTDVAGRAFETKALTSELDSVIPDPDEYFTESEIPAGRAASTLYLFFDNGACVNAVKTGIDANSEDYLFICGVNVRYAMMAIDMTKKRAYDDVFEMVLDNTASGPPMEYGEVMKMITAPGNGGLDSYYLMEVNKVLTRSECEEIEGWFDMFAADYEGTIEAGESNGDVYYFGNRTVYEVNIVKDLVKGTEMNETVYLPIETGDPNIQAKGDPPYAPGEMFCAALRDPIPNCGLRKTTGDFMLRFDVYAESGGYMAKTRFSNGARFPAGEVISETRVTSTTKNPVTYYKQVPLDELADFLQSDWQSRGIL